MRRYGDATDRQLLTLVGDGSVDAFDELYFRYSPPVTRYVWALCNSRESAQEVLQDTFLTLWRKASSIQLAGDSVLPWLLLASRKHASNMRRSEFRIARIAETLMRQKERIPAAVPGESELQWVLDTIAALSEPDRAVVQMCIVDRLTYKQAAARLGTSEAAIGKRLQRSRSTLRKALAHDE